MIVYVLQYDDNDCVELTAHETYQGAQREAIARIREQLPIWQATDSWHDDPVKTKQVEELKTLLEDPNKWYLAMDLWNGMITFEDGDDAGFVIYDLEVKPGQEGDR